MMEEGDKIFAKCAMSRSPTGVSLGKETCAWVAVEY